jgi:hypothetical protein
VITASTTSFTLHPSSPRRARKSSSTNEAQTMRRASVSRPLNGSSEIGSKSMGVRLPAAASASRARPSSARGLTSVRSSDDRSAAAGAPCGAAPFVPRAGGSSDICSRTCVPLTPSIMLWWTLHRIAVRPSASPSMT